MKHPIVSARARSPLIRPLLLALGAGLLLLLAAAFGSGPAQADPSTVVGTDADPTGSTATSLGPIDPCRSASIGETFQVDVYVQDVANLGGYQTYLVYDPRILRLTAYNHDFFLFANPGAIKIDLSDALPDQDGFFLMAVADLGSTTGDTGSGVLTRLTFEAQATGDTAIVLTGLILPDAVGNAMGDLDGDGYFDGATPGALIRVGQSCPTGPGDADADGVADASDNCPDVGNPDQGDADADGIGDWCDDGDVDYLPDARDNCPNAVNYDQADADGDALGDPCDPDRDGDGVPNGSDNLPDVFNPDQLDTDGDTIADARDVDADGDGVPDKGAVATICCVDLDSDGDQSSDGSEFVISTPGLPLGAKQEVPLCCMTGNGSAYQVFVGVAYGWTTLEVVDLDGDGEMEVSVKDFGQPPGQQQVFDLALMDPDSDVDIVVLGGGPLGRQAPPSDVDGDGEKEVRVWEPGLAAGTALNADVDADGDADLRWSNAAVSGIDNCPDTANVDQTNTDAALAAAGASVPADALGDACDGDDDNDGFADAREAAMATLPLDNCPQTPGAHDEPDAWPPDADDDRDADIGDAIGLFRGIINEPGNYQPRSDMDADSDVDMGDVIQAFGSGRMNSSCS